jgi:hypothetical protein
MQLWGESMKKLLLLLTLICSFCLLNSCGSGNSTPPPPVATHFSVAVPVTATIGMPFNVTVTALDGSNNMVGSYSGTVQFSSSDGQPVQPPSGVLTGGMGTFPLTLNIAGSPTITATAGSLKGNSNAITVVAVSARLTVLLAGYNYATIGSPFNITVTAVDAVARGLYTEQWSRDFFSNTEHFRRPNNLSNGQGLQFD